MLDLTDAERDLLISDIKELLSWQIPKGHHGSDKQIRILYKNLLNCIEWDMIPDTDEQTALVILLEDLVDDDWGELQTPEETAMRQSILSKAYRWRC